jgi:hypothetical protein
MIETAVINYTIGEQQTAGELTREIMELIEQYKK